MKILIVDDDSAVAMSLAKRLGLRKHHVTVELDPLVAQGRLLAGEWFDVVVSDMNMPGMTGFELRVVAASLPERPMFVLMSGGHDVGDGDADFVLSKPFQLTHLLDVLAILARRKAKATTMQLPRLHYAMA